MSNLLGVSGALALLDRLKSDIEDFAAREERLEHGFLVRSSAEKKAFETTSNAQATQQAEALASQEAWFATENQKCQTRFEQRKRRINEAHKNLRRRAMEDVTSQEGRRKHKLQEGALHAERKRDADLAAAANWLTEFRQRLAESEQSLALLGQAAHRAFAGFHQFRKLLSPNSPWPDPDLSADEIKLFEELRRLETDTSTAVGRLKKKPLVLLKRFLPPLWFLGLALLLSFLSSLDFAHSLGLPSRPFPARFDYWILGLMVVRAVVYFSAKQQASSLARLIAGNLARARRLHDACYQKADARHAQEQERIKKDFQDTNATLDQDWKRAVKEAIDLRDQRPRQVDEKAQRTAQKNEQTQEARTHKIQAIHADRLEQVQREAEVRSKALAQGHSGRLAKIVEEHQSQWQILQTEWRASLDPIFNAIQQANATANQLFPEWQLPLWQNWSPPSQFINAAKFATLEVDLDKFARAKPKDPRLAFPGPATFPLPLLLSYPREGSILFEVPKTGGDAAIAAINNIIFRLLAATPPGKLSFTILDPVGLGQSFAGIMHLADYEESHINSRIWTQTTQIEEKLAELNEHMEKVIQMYLRNEYETIADYNKEAGTIAEKYHFLVVASFPVNFSDTAARRLRNIAASGARCGVYTLIYWDQRHPLPQDFVPDELRKNSVCLLASDRGFDLAGRPLPGARLLLDAPPSPEVATHFLHRVGASGKDSNRVEVPFEQVAPQDSNLWTENTTEELRVPIGRSGATKLQYLAIGKGTRQHALIAGKTGSGKSTLFHVIITNLALWCSPEQVEFYLVDFKKGVEFKCYANRRLPHARVVAIESDRQFGLSVLERVDAELRRRGDLFRQLGVQDLPGYKRAGGSEAIPRSLLMIDEFQEFFVEEDRISQSAAVLLDRIVRQGRAFGIHVLLGSQTLGGAYTLARATLGQMVIRIALQCNEADAYLIMDQDNPAPRLLSRPGEGIYNDEAGSIEGNSPFQAVWLPDEVRDVFLARVRDWADKKDGRYGGPFVFEGNAPADVRENVSLVKLLRAGSVEPAAASRIWLGAPNSIKGPTEAVFQKQSANNMLVVGQNDEAALAAVAMSLICLSAQYPLGSVRFVLLESTAPGSPHREFLDRVLQAVPHTVLQARTGDVADLINGVADDLKRQMEGSEPAASQRTFVLVHGLENFKKLRAEDEFSFSVSEAGAGPNPASSFLNLISDGPSHGFHVITTCDTYNNVSRFLGRKNLGEFAVRVLFQMSASDSASLIDAPDAGTLGMHRALLYNDREGYLETFRPYGRPGNEWLEEVAVQLHRVGSPGTELEFAL